MSDPDDAAALLIQRHGTPDAALVAAQRADEFEAMDDADGHDIWRAILDF